MDKAEPLKEKKVILDLDSLEVLIHLLKAQQTMHHYALYDIRDVESALDWLESQITDITTAEGFRIKMREAFPDIYGDKR